ncbi:MAG: glucans biosynthesis glucosyltransferase MdoH [Geminicoccaceae bacterium]|nr:MAG: glucans biosynthesis glucosyltransferase MdoH [Geminicoccaceae bacterium]
MLDRAAPSALWPWPAPGGHHVIEPTGSGAAPDRLRERRLLGRRRLAFLALTSTTALAALATLAMILGGDGFTVLDLAMLAAFAVTLPWTVIGFWNAVIGLALASSRRDPLRAVVPLAGLDDANAPLRGRTAIVVPVYDEDPELVLAHLAATVDDLALTGSLDGFDVFLLSDTQDPDLARDEAMAVEAFRRRCRFVERFHYRRRRDNAAFKTGNLWEFLERHGDRFDYMVVLDADSLMTGAAIRRLVRVMDQNPRLGILQTLIMGLPSQIGFTRMFQFGMRHGMRAYTLGSAWWQGPAGPYWGHNAIIRIDAFKAHCRLATLPGRPPLGGLILSHDQVEAAMMHRAGFDVRVLPDEFGSYEINPPCLPEFTRRSLRWCQGNMQYLKLVARPGWPPMPRLQLALAILMYVAGPAWLTFMALGFVQGAIGFDGGTVAANPWGATSSELAIWFLLAMLTMTFAPKICGLIDALAQPERRRRYGGGVRLAVSGLLEFVHGMILAPIMAIAEALFLARLARGRGLTWSAQRRHGQAVGWAEAARRFWPQTLVGCVVLTAFGVLTPHLLPWVIPVALGPLLAIPFAHFSTRPALGRTLARWGVAAVPEELAPPAVVARAVPLAAAVARGQRRRPGLQPVPAGGD